MGGDVVVRVLDVVLRNGVNRLAQALQHATSRVRFDWAKDQGASRVSLVFTPRRSSKAGWLPGSIPR